MSASVLKSKFCCKNIFYQRILERRSRTLFSNKNLKNYLSLSETLSDVYLQWISLSIFVIAFCLYLDVKERVHVPKNGAFIAVFFIRTSSFDFVWLQQAEIRFPPKSGLKDETGMEETKYFHCQNRSMVTWLNRKNNYSHKT